MAVRFREAFNAGRTNWIAVLVTAILVYLAATPILFLVFGAFNERVGELNLTLQYFARAYGDSEILKLFSRTAVFAVVGGFLSLLLGAAAAWITERTNTRLRSTVIVTSLLAMSIPTILVAIAWVMLLGPGAGLINIWLKGLFNLSEAPFNIYTMAGMIWVEGAIGAPFAYVLMLPFFQSEDRSLEESSKMSGGTSWQTLLRITIPLSIPGLLSVAIYRFIRGIEAFDIPAVLGLPRGIELLSTRIYRVVNEEMSYALGNAYAIGTALLSVLCIYFYYRVLKQSQKYAVITGKGYRPIRLDLGRWRFAASGYLLLYLLLVAILPVAAVIWSSFLPYTQLPSLSALSQFTLVNYQMVMEKMQVWRAFRNTFFLAALTPVICVFLATIASWIVVRTKTRGRWLLDFLSFAIIAIPGITLGVALVWVYLSLPLPIYGTVWILLIGYVTVFLPISMRFMSPAMVQVHKDLEDSAYLSGASWSATFRRILAPLLLPAAIGAGLYIFVHIFRVLSMAIMVYTPKTIVVPVLIFNLWGESQQGNSIQALLVLTVIAVLPFALLYYWVIKRYGLGSRAT
ncbi:MAG: iron ABC transporter permease [Chloroflexi bacterium]|nr:iron ABC transporter permease [Chloroflexota bacterium]